LLPSLYCVIVNWNLSEETIHCVDSLLAAGCTLEQIIVVDNGSTDTSAADLRAKYGQALILLANWANLGFAGGVNAGIRYAHAHGAEWIVILNNDTFCDPTFFDELERAISASPGTAIFAPLILRADELDRVWYLGDRQLFGTFLTRSMARGTINRGQYPAIIPVDFVSGCCMLIHRSVICTIGLFEEAFFMYAEDVDYCRRARLRGIKLACATRCRLWHRVSVSADKNASESVYLRIRNQLLFYKKYARPLESPLLIAFSTVRCARLFALHLLRGHFALARSTIRGWIDGWLSRRYLATLGHANNHL
jgi:GT2 family glycosyltransferase